MPLVRKCIVYRERCILCRLISVARCHFCQYETAQQNLNSIAYLKKWFGEIFNEIVAIKHEIFWNLQTFLKLLIKFNQLVGKNVYEHILKSCY